MWLCSKRLVIDIFIEIVFLFVYRVNTVKSYESREKLFIDYISRSGCKESVEFIKCPTETDKKLRKLQW